MEKFALVMSFYNDNACEVSELPGNHIHVIYHDRQKVNAASNYFEMIRIIIVCSNLKIVIRAYHEFEIKRFPFSVFV